MASFRGRDRERSIYREEERRAAQQAHTDALVDQTAAVEALKKAQQNYDLAASRVQRTRQRLMQFFPKF